MATLHESETENIIINASKETISFQTSETSIPAINISGYQNNDMAGQTGIAIDLSSVQEDIRQIITKAYLYGNKNAIILPSEIGASVSGHLSFLDGYVDVQHKSI